MPTNVFVYGSLLPGHYNHRLLEGKYAEALPAKLAGAVMYDYGAFPGIVKTDDADRIAVGMIFTGIDAETLRRLDGLEGYRAGDRWNFYNREKVTVTTDAGDRKCWAYYLNQTHEDLADCPTVPNGDWAKYGRNR